MTVTILRNPQGEAVNLRICIRDITSRQRSLKILESSDYDLASHRLRHFYSRGDSIPLHPRSIWLVCQGIVKLSTISQDNEEVLVGLAGPQMPFGSSFTRLPIYQATALSKNVQLVSMELSEIAASPNLAQALLPKINRRLQQTESFLAISGHVRLVDRLQQLLLLLEEEIGQPATQGTRLSVRLTHSDLANACCTTRVTMTRLLGKLKKQGKIFYDNQGHIIVIKDKLAQLSPSVTCMLLNRREQGA